MMLSGVETIGVPMANQFTLQAQAFARAVLGETPLPIPLESSVANMKIIDALFRSEQTQRWKNV